MKFSTENNLQWKHIYYNEHYLLENPPVTFPEALDGRDSMVLTEQTLEAKSKPQLLHQSVCFHEVEQNGSSAVKLHTLRYLIVIVLKYFRYHAVRHTSK